MSKESIEDIPAGLRRIDSIAWLIQGDDVCGSACFDGEKLLLSTNKREESDLVRETLEHLKYTARKAEELSRLSKDGVNYESEVEEFELKIDESQNKVLQILRKTNLYKSSLNYKLASEDALTKLTNSILISYINPESNKALNPSLIKAIRNKQIEFVQVDEARNKKAIHAEMKVLHRLIETKKVPNISKASFYIGVSKKCCANCETVIKAINNVMGNSINEIINVREEGHKKYFPAGIPKFLDYEDGLLTAPERRKLRQEFFKLAGDKEESLTSIFEKLEGNDLEQIHRRSKSPPERMRLVEKLDKWTKEYTKTVEVSSTFKSADNSLTKNSETKYLSEDKTSIKIPAAAQNTFHAVKRSEKYVEKEDKKKAKRDKSETFKRAK